MTFRLVLALGPRFPGSLFDVLAGNTRLLPRVSEASPRPAAGDESSAAFCAVVAHRRLLARNLVPSQLHMPALAVLGMRHCDRSRCGRAFLPRVRPNRPQFTLRWRRSLASLSSLTGTRRYTSRYRPCSNRRLRCARKVSVYESSWPCRPRGRSRSASRSSE